MKVQKNWWIIQKTMEEERTEDISEEIMKTSPQGESVGEEVAQVEEIIAEEIASVKPQKDEIEIRKEELVKFIKQKKDFLIYLILGAIVFIGLYIRTRNIPKLKDITTGTWTLGPDLDPFLFLRWTKDIVQHGTLFTVDMMRNVPLGSDTSAEMKLLAYMVAWFHQGLSFFSLTDSVTYSAIIFPVVMFGFTIIAFFLFTRKIFYKEDKISKNIIALIATALFAVVPSLLARTIAGIPEKESAGFFFIFMAFYFILEAFTSEKMRPALIFGILAGVMTGLLGLIWGGVTFVITTIGGVVLIAFILGRMNEKRVYAHILWIATFCIIMIPFSERYTLEGFLVSFSSGLNFAMAAIAILHILVFEKKIWGIGEKLKKRINLPPYLISFILAGLIVAFLSSVFFGAGFIPSKVTQVVDQVLHPLDVSRFGLTVAENKQPFFINDWKNSFGPIYFNIPLYFWLFFIGSIVLFYELIKKMGKQERFVLTGGYTLFLFGLIFSKYSSSSSLNGDSTLSFIVYFGGALIFVGLFAKYYFERYKKDSTSVFEKFNVAYILYFSILTMTIIGARGAIRLIMVLAALSPVVVGFLIVKTYQKFILEKEELAKVLLGLVLILFILASIFTFWNYYQSDKHTGENFAPGVYQFQWQKAMQWVRENTSEDAVFAHWWDYGYWVQSIGNRATVLDGGNAIVYWNYLMGRLVLTGPDEQKALEFLYTHDVTHLLIDSTEIGKYTAFSSIGSDKNYDRFAWISTFIMDEKQTQETQNVTTYVYSGGTALDSDISWKDNSTGKEIFLPRRAAGVGALIVKRTSSGNLLQPETIFVYNNQQYRIPLKTIYIGDQLYKFDSGIDAGMFVYPLLNQASTGGLSINPNGAALFLSPRTVHSGVARYYLFNQSSEYVQLAHTEPSYFVNNLRSQGVTIGEFVQYQGFQGPIKIWDISYPKGMKKNPEFLKTSYPNEELRLAKKGEY